VQVYRIYCPALGCLVWNTHIYLAESPSKQKGKQHDPGWNQRYIFFLAKQEKQRNKGNSNWWLIPNKLADTFEQQEPATNKPFRRVDCESKWCSNDDDMNTHLKPWYSYFKSSSLSSIQLKYYSDAEGVGCDTTNWFTEMKI
jgi:hypothetical protein